MTSPSAHVCGPCGDPAQVPTIATRTVDTPDGPRVELALTSDPYGWRVRTWLTPDQAQVVAVALLDAIPDAEDADS